MVVVLGDDQPQQASLLLIRFGIVTGIDHRLRVLVSAFACAPGRGSEPRTGWETVRVLAPRHDLTVVTRSQYRRTIEAEVAREGGPLAGVRFVYLDADGLPETWLDSRNWGENVVYLAWQLRVRRWVRRHVDLFDLAHHVTFVRYWVAPGVAGVPGLACVIGPVGGADSAPPALAATLSRRGRLAGRVRDGVRAFFSSWPGLRRAVSTAEVCLATSPAAVQSLRRLGAGDVRIAPDVFARPEAVAASRTEPAATPPLVVGAGRMIEWKAYHLAVLAWARAAVPGYLALYGAGPSLERVRALAEELGVADRVRLPGAVPRDDVLNALRQARLFVHPSLHDSGGTVIVEALQNGVPVVCWDHAGPGQMVDSSCGAAIPVDDVPADDAIEAMASAIRRLVTDDEAWRAAAEGALERVRTRLNTEAHADRLEASYRAAFARSTYDGNGSDNSWG